MAKERHGVPCSQRRLRKSSWRVEGAFHGLCKVFAKKKRNIFLMNAAREPFRPSQNPSIVWSRIAEALVRVLGLVAGGLDIGLLGLGPLL